MSPTASSRAGPGGLLPATVGALGDADHAREPRSRHPRLHTDHLEVLEGPRRPSAERFHTRSWTCVSPRAAFSSSISASSSRSLGSLIPLRPPSARPSFAPAWNCCFQRLTDCSDTFPCRAAYAIVISPEITDNTSLSLSSVGITGGRPLRCSLHREPDFTTLPTFSKRDRTIRVRQAATMPEAPDTYPPPTSDPHSSAKSPKKRPVRLAWIHRRSWMRGVRVPSQAGAREHPQGCICGLTPNPHSGRRSVRIRAARCGGSRFSSMLFGWART